LRWIPFLSVAAALAGGVWAQAPDDKLPRRATCPIEGKVLTPTPTLPLVYVNGTQFFFCAAGCRDRFTAWPEKYVKGMTVYCTVQPNFKSHMDLARRSSVNNNLYYLCCEPCVGWMRDKPHLYVKQLRDVVSGKWFQVTEANPKSLYKGQVYLFENAETKAAFDREPPKFVVEFKRP
jgi:YHS domain-containing protein